MRRFLAAPMLLALSFGPAGLFALAQTAPAQTAPAQTVPAPALATPLTHAGLQDATFVVLPPVIQGGNALVSGDQRSAILSAMSRDSAGAISRRYPGARFAADANLPGAVRVTPLLVAPGALLPWANFAAQLTLQSPGQPDLTLQQQFNVWTIYTHRAEAANFMFDQLARQLP